VIRGGDSAQSKADEIKARREAEGTLGQPQPVATPSEPQSGSQTVAQAGGGPTTHAPAREPLRAFVWPCEKRTAHESHGDCPGVMAHPLTMIGGGYRAVETEADPDGD
jgi:hypothetical protein